jgi:signal transduction histidine kinase
VLTVTTLLYPLVFQGMDAQRRGRMTDAALSFEQGRDPRVLFAVEQVLERIRRDTLLQRSEVTAALRRSPQARTVPATGGRSTEDAGRLDTVATQLLQGSLLASLTAYDASLTLIGPDQQGLRYTAAGLEVQRTRLDADGRDTFRALLERYRLEQPRGPLVEQELTPQQSRRADGGLVYAGIAPLRPLSPGPRSSLFPPNPFGSGSSPEAAGPLGALPPLAGAAPADSAKVWAMVQVRSRSLLPGVGGAFPRVLLPDGSYSDLYAELSLAAFQDGTLARSIGRDFERVQLPAAVQQQLADEPTLWRTETVGQRQYLTHYRRAANGASTLTAGRGGADETASSVTAVRIPSIMVFDHLYYLLRIVVVGLGLALGFYLVGLYARWRRGLLPAEHVRFRDKVLNAFLAVGAVAVVAVGVVGVQVVTGENERVVGRRLQDDLDRVEEALALEARPDERIYRVAERVDIDSLAAQVGLDISLYRDGQLVRSSRPQLVRDGLVEARLPAPAYRAIYADAYRFITTEVRIGSFPYTIGVRALTDAEGRPRYSIAVPTLAQQERIREERARTLAYLFGALLLLVIAVMLTALLLANALTQPIAQLRAGLEAVGEGRFTQALPVTTRDEIGELVRTFNEMREQLAESRRKLAQQERELAWREMARQVAHEIKNPLTPMKLSVQHLRRAFRRAQPTGGRANEQSAGDGAAAEADDSRFGALFDRITSTLIEQIHALARIADEFSSFARLPTRVVESLDLNEVIREAESLMREEDTDITLDVTLHEEPLVIEADHEEMRRIFINLIKNAMQAIPDERDGRIEITTARIDIPDAPPRVRATVTDNGSGVPRDLRDKIFQPNFSTKTSGTGLGLAIAKKTIEELGGEIGFHTTEGVGTTFWLQLPTADAAPDDTGGVPPTPAQSGSPRGPANGDTTPSGDGAAPTSPSGADAEAEDASSNDAASGDPAPDDPDAGGATA